MNLDAIQSALRESAIDGWLFYDHHHRDPIAERILSLDPKAHITRRWYYFIPASGEPRKLVHRIEQGRLDALPGAKAQYSSWQELRAGLENLLQNQKKIAMQYSPNNDIMYVSMVDAGTIEFLRSLGKEIVTSADLVSQFETVLSENQIASHSAAQRAIDSIVAEAWLEIGRRLRPPSGQPRAFSEYDMVVWLRESMRHEGLVWENGPDVSVNSEHFRLAPMSQPPIAPCPSTRATSSSSIFGAVSTRPKASTTTSPGPASLAVSLLQKNSLSSRPSAAVAMPPSH